MPVNVRELVDDHRARIDEGGMAIQGVRAHGLEPSWVYTIGLWRNAAHPELVLIGLDPGEGGRILEYLGRQVQAGVRFHPGSFGSGVFRDWSHRFVDVGEMWRVSSDWFNLGRVVMAHCYGERWPPTLQVVWPDRYGRYPDEPAAPIGHRFAQPVLSDHVADRLRGERGRGS